MNIVPRGTPVYLLFDEIQYSSEWATEIKWLVNYHPEYCILATGSASVLHHKAMSESGVGG